MICLFDVLIDGVAIVFKVLYGLLVVIVLLWAGYGAIGVGFSRCTCLWVCSGFWVL